MQVAIGKSHPLANKASILVTDLLSHPFATPYISPFCGEPRGPGCDGWREQLLPRKTAWIVNDYAVISQLVKSGQAIAYLPNFFICEWQLKALNVEDYPYQYREKMLLLCHSKAPRWVHNISNGLVG